MDLSQIVDMQTRLDEKNGFPVRFPERRQLYGQLTKDLVGLMGEIGEFSNIVKKINIKLDRPREYDLDFNSAEVSLREELVDSLIYLIRIGAMLEVDLEKEVLAKIRLNAARYANLRQE